MNKLRKPPSGFTMVPNALIRSATLSLKAKGLYCLLFSKPDNWIYVEEALIKESADGRESYRSGIKELVDTGWLNKVQVRDEKGVFSHIDWHLSVDGKPVVGESVDGQAVAGQSPANNTDDIKTDGIKTLPPTPKGAAHVNPFAVDFELEFWPTYPNKVGKPAALKAYLKAKPELPALRAGLQLWKESTDWQKDDGRFIPHPTTFLNQRRWEDIPREMAKPKTQEQAINDACWDTILNPNQQKQLA